VQKHVGRNVRARAPEHRVPERKQPRVPEHHVEGEREQSPRKDVHRQDGIDEARQDDEQERDARANQPAPVAHCASCRPNRPAGRRSSTSAMRMKIKVFAIGGYNADPIATSTPTAYPVTTDPRIDPRPPITTTANVVMISSDPISGSTL